MSSLIIKGGTTAYASWWKNWEKYI